MTTKSSRPPHETADETMMLAPFNAWLQTSNPMMTAMVEINAKLVEQMAKASNEWLAFLNRRFSEDLATSQRMMCCKTMQDVVDTCTDFVERANEQYASEFQHLSRLNQHFADETATVMKAHLDETAGAVRH